MRIIIIRNKKSMSPVNKSNVLQTEVIQQHSVLFNETESGRQINSSDLLDNRESLSIKHQGELYILRQTRAGKLILTK